MTAPQPPDGFKALVLDIECIPNLGWHWGLFDQSIPMSMVEERARVVCFAAKWLGQPKKTVQFYSEWGDEGRLGMLGHAARLLSEADAVIGYNSKPFDIKWLYGEIAVEGFGRPTPHHDIDLLRTIKAKFRFPSNKLDNVSQYFDLGAKTQHGGWTLWKGVIDRDPAALKLMEKYNRQDILLTEKLHDRILPWIDAYPNVALYDTGQSDGCPKCGAVERHRRGHQTTATASFQRYQCTGCGSYYREARKDDAMPASSHRRL